MLSRRFGQKLKLPWTAAIKHQLLLMMLEDEIRATSAGPVFDADKSAALAQLRRLGHTRMHPVAN
jgi:hypothetical protein